MDMESDFDPGLSEKDLQNGNDKSASLLAEAVHLSLDPTLGDSKSSPTQHSESYSQICFKPQSSGNWHSILRTDSKSALRKPNLSELKEEYQNAKERVKEPNIDKLWTSHVEREDRNASASLSDIVTAAFWIREGVPRTSCEVCKQKNTVDILASGHQRNAP